MEGRYEIYGVIPSEHADDNSDTPDQQKVGNTVRLYATDDKAECMEIMRNGGFEREGGPWSAATWAKDTETGRCIGDVPAEAGANG